MTETIIYFTFTVRDFNFICRTVQIQKKISRFAVGNSHPARQWATYGHKKRAVKLFILYKFGPGGIRTHDQGIMSPLRYRCATGP